MTTLMFGGRVNRETFVWLFGQSTLIQRSGLAFGGFSLGPNNSFKPTSLRGAA